MKLNLILLFSFSVLIPVFGNKYAKEANDFEDDKNQGDEQNFRTQKLNFVWSKAFRKLESSDRNDLLLHLKKLDKQFLASKYEKDGGSDQEGLLEKEIEKALENLLNKYGLSTIYKSLATGAGDKKIEDDRNENYLGGQKKSTSFKDQKLRRLWLDAVSDGGFDGDELSALEEEFQHHQKKLDEYGKMSIKAAKKLSSEEKENSVLHDDEEDDKSKPVKNAELKQRFKDIQRDYDSLKIKVADKVQTKKENVQSISHPRVVALLEKARSMYSGPELESIEEELRHFEARLKKLEYLEKEAAQGKAEIDNDPAKTKSKKEKSSKIYDREVVEQLSDYTRKVEKYEKYLASKVEL